MAVFPDRIVLKNSTDSQATIEAAIAGGGSDPITQGELVLGLEPGDLRIYSLDGSGNVISFAPTASSGRAIISDTPPTLGINNQPLAEGDLWFESDTGSYYVYYGVAWVEVSGGGGNGSGGLNNIVEDTTPQLGGDLDVNGNYIASASGGDVVVAPDTTGNFIVRGNNTDGSITLNCTANTHGVTIQSPPHADAATYSLILPSSAGTAGQVLTSQGGAQLTWEDAGSGGFADPMTTDGDIIIRSGGTTTRLGIGSESQVLTVSSGLPVWAAAPTGGGGGGSTGSRLTEAQTAASGAATFTGLGHNGTLVSVTSSLDAWIVLYGSAADRTADSGRGYSTDPAPGSGVLAEFYVTAGSTVLATPGTSYFNNDTSVTEALYAAVRDQAGANVDSEVTIVAYGEQTITTVTGGTFGSG